MTDFDSIWRTQDEIRTVVNAVLGECIWNLAYNGENRPGVDGKIPQIRDLRYGDSIECYADKVFLLHRPEYYDILLDEEGYDQRGVLRVIVAKNTYGPTGEFRLKYDKEKGQITDIDENM